MTKKSASEMKVVKKNPASRETRMKELQESFDDMKKISLIVMDAQLKIARRVDNMSNLRAFIKDYYGETPRIEVVKEAVEMSVKVYEDIRAAIESWTLDEFLKPEIKNYFEHLVPTIDDVNDDGDLLDAMIKYLTVKPYGEKLIESHRLIQDEAARLDLLEKEDEEK